MLPLRVFILLIAFTLLIVPAVQARPNAAQVCAYLKRECVSGVCLQVKVWCPDSGDIVVTATTGARASDSELADFVTMVAKCVFADDDAPSLAVFFEQPDKAGGGRCASLSRNAWQTIQKDQPAASLLSFADEAVGSLNSAQEVEATMVAAQPLDGQHVQLVERIQILKKKGVGVEPYLKLIQEYQSDMNRGASQAASQKLDRLAASIQSQEKLHSARSTVRLKTGILQVVTSLPPPPQLSPTIAEHVVAPGSSPAPSHGRQAEKPPDAFVLMNQVLGMKSINDLTGPEKTAQDRFLLTIAEKALGTDCPDTDGPFLLERVRIALRIQELEHRKVPSGSYREYNRDKIESLVRAHNPRYARQIADNIQYLERQIGVKELERSPITR